jgi:hypothetical protein
MAQVSEAVVKIKADTSQFNRQMRRVQWSLWLFQWGPWIALAGTLLFGAAIGAVLGVVLS